MVLNVPQTLSGKFHWLKKLSDDVKSFFVVAKNGYWEVKYKLLTSQGRHGGISMY